MTGIVIRAGAYFEMDGVTPFANPDSLAFMRDNPPTACNHYHLWGTDGTGNINDGACEAGTFYVPFVCQGRCWPDGEGIPEKCYSSLNLKCVEQNIAGLI